MKNIAILTLTIILAAAVLTGCRRNVGVETTEPSVNPTQATTATTPTPRPTEASKPAPTTPKPTTTMPQMPTDASGATSGTDRETQGAPSQRHN